MTVNNQMFAKAFHLLVQLIHSGLGLRMVDIHLPSIAVFGKPAQLNCTYELEQDQLYSIKWYFNDNEFYRYLPNDSPPEQFYHTRGLHIDLAKSSKSLVYLKKVDLRTSGLFRVEVSGEAPSFQTVRKEKYLNVYYFPRNAPSVRLKNRTDDLRINDVLDVSCQSGPARPATQLHWYINDIPISQAYANLTEIVSPIILDVFDVEENPPYKSDTAYESPSDDQELNSIDYQLNSMNQQSRNISYQSNSLILFNTTLRLRIRLRESLLKSTKTLKLRCTSYNTHVFTKSSEHVFKVLAALRSSYQDQRSLDNGDLSTAVDGTFSRKKNSFIKNFNKRKFGPFIDNTRSNYAVGDLINVTCFTGQSTKPPAFLQCQQPSTTPTPQPPVDTSTAYSPFENLIEQQSTPSWSTINQTSIELINNRKREIKLKCTAQLSRIVHVKTRQLSLGDQSRLSAVGNDGAMISNGLSVNQLNLRLYRLIAISGALALVMRVRH